MWLLNSGPASSAMLIYTHHTFEFHFFPSARMDDDLNFDFERSLEGGNLLTAKDVSAVWFLSCMPQWHAALARMAKYLLNLSACMVHGPLVNHAWTWT